MERQPDWVGLRKVRSRDLFSLSVVVAGLFEIKLAGFGVLRELTKVSIEVGQHLAEEDYSLCSLYMMLVGDYLLLDQLDQIVAHLHQLLPDLVLRLLQTLVHALLLTYFARHSLDDFQLGSPGTDHVFVCRGTETAFGWCKFFLREHDFVCESEHLIVSFGLLCQFGQQHVVLLLEVLPLHHYILKSNYQPNIPISSFYPLSVHLDQSNCDCA